MKTQKTTDNRGKGGEKKKVRLRIMQWRSLLILLFFNLTCSHVMQQEKLEEDALKYEAWGKRVLFIK
jgi:hypothetical protein